MTSYKNVVKFDYAKNPSDVVALKEYIIFDDAKEGEKYALLKFVNNLNQPLYAIKFEVYQHDAGGNVLSKTLLSHDKFTASENEVFVPKAKLKLSANCESISVKLLAAKFDRIRWEKGEFKDNSYTFERYVHDSGKAIPPARGEGFRSNDFVADKEVRKRKSSAFDIRDVARKNMAVFPQVMCVIFVLLVLAFSIGSAVYFRNSSKEFSLGEFTVVSLTDKTVGISGYEGKSSSVTVPKTLGGYNVVQIRSGAFKKSKVKNLVIEADLTLDGGAFAGSDLTEVYSDAAVNVLSRAFEKCEKLSLIKMPNAKFTSSCFNGSFASSRRLELLTSSSLGNDVFEECGNLRALRLSCGSLSESSLKGLDGIEKLELHSAGGIGDLFVSLFGAAQTVLTESVSLKILTVETPLIKSGYFNGCADSGISVNELYFVNVRTLGETSLSGFKELQRLYLPESLEFNGNLGETVNGSGAKEIWFEGNVDTDGFNSAQFKFNVKDAENYYKAF
ncbi:MAG: leucine-rich repeat protein [Clostridia bacterium]|nr:leucine-rich repeat protein [Clostridia bacterium]